MPTNTATLLCLLLIFMSPEVVQTVTIENHDCPASERWSSNQGRCVPCPETPLAGDRSLLAWVHYEDNCNKYPSCCGNSSHKTTRWQEPEPTAEQTYRSLSGTKNHSDITDDGGYRSIGGKNKSAANGDISRTGGGGGGGGLSASVLFFLIVAGVLVVVLPAVVFTGLLTRSRFQRSPSVRVTYQRARDVENQGGGAPDDNRHDDANSQREVGGNNGGQPDRPLPPTPHEQLAAAGETENSGQAGQQDEGIEHAESRGSSEEADEVTRHLLPNAPVYAGSSTYDSASVPDG